MKLDAELLAFDVIEIHLFDSLVSLYYFDEPDGAKVFSAIGLRSFDPEDLTTHGDTPLDPGQEGPLSHLAFAPLLDLLTVERLDPVFNLLLGKSPAEPGRLLRLYFGVLFAALPCFPILELEIIDLRELSGLGFVDIIDPFDLPLFDKGLYISRDRRLRDPELFGDLGL
jgi:hypothetical protein